MSLIYLGQHIFVVVRWQTDFFDVDCHRSCFYDLMQIICAVDRCSPKKAWKYISCHIFRWTDLLMLFAVFFSVPSPYNTKYILGRRPLNSLMGCPFISSFIFSSTFFVDCTVGKVVAGVFARVIKIEMMIHIVVEIVSLCRMDQTVIVCHEKDSTITLCWIDMIVMKLVHENFWNIHFEIWICRHMSVYLTGCLVWQYILLLNFQLIF